MELGIERARLEDLEVMLDLYAQLHPEDRRPDPGHALEAWKLILAAPSRQVLLARLGGTPAGTAEFSIVPNLTRGAKSFVLIENVVVHDQFRRQGIGSAILNEIKRRTENAGVYKMQLSVDVRGPLEFYLKHDFKVQGLTMKSRGSEA